MSSELEEIRKKKLAQLMQSQMQQDAQYEMQRRMQEEQVESQIKLILERVLEPDAKQRLANIRLARPDYARQVEILLINLYQGGQLPRKLTDEEFKKVLARIQGMKRETKITGI